MIGTKRNEADGHVEEMILPKRKGPTERMTSQRGRQRGMKLPAMLKG